jgi:hypothetical protein
VDRSNQCRSLKQRPGALPRRSKAVEWGGLGSGELEPTGQWLGARWARLSPVSAELP